MPVWKAGREGIREREVGSGEWRRRRGEGERRGGVREEVRGVLRGVRQKRICVLKLVASPLCVFCGYEVSSTFCFVIISALGIHLPNGANWLLKGVTHSVLVFDKIIHGGLYKWRILKYEWSYLRETTLTGFYCSAVSRLYSVSVSVCARVSSPIGDKKTPNATWSLGVDSAGWGWMEDYMQRRDACS